MWYKAQAAYLKKALENNIEIIRAYSLTMIWRNITNLGCSYEDSIENDCWEHCPAILKDEHLGVFKTPFIFK